MRNQTIRALLIPLLLLASGCTIWRPSGGGLLNPCGSHRCDARPASYKTNEPPALKEGKQYKLRDCGLLRVPTEQRATATYDRCWQCHAVRKAGGDGPPPFNPSRDPAICGGWTNNGTDQGIGGYGFGAGRGYIMKDGKIVADPTCPDEFWGKAERRKAEAQR